MKILLTGTTGQVGYELAHSLQDLGKVITVDRRQMDLADIQQIRSVLGEIKPQLIVNPAAYTAVDQAEEEPELAMRINRDAPAVLAEEAKKLGAALIHYSTDYVFDGKKEGAYTEQDLPCPLSLYGKSKLAGEQAIQAVDIPYLILRTSWVYGLRGKNFLLTIRRLARERDELRIVADQIGAPTWCRTIAETTARILAQRELWQDHPGVYHLTAQGQTTWHGFAQAIVTHDSCGKKPVVTPISTNDYPTRALRPANSVLSCQQLIARFGELPQWDEALSTCLNNLEKSQHFCPAHNT